MPFLTAPQSETTKLVAGKVIADTTFSNNGSENAIFPLSNRSDYLGKIVFSVVEDEETNIDEIKEGIRTDQEAIAARDNSFDERGEKLKKGAKENARRQKEKAEAKAQGLRPSTKNSSAQQREPVSTLKTATLFLPQAISFADGVQYENVDLGTIGLTALNAAAGATSGSGGLSGFLEGFKGPAGEGTGNLVAGAVAKAGGDAVAAGYRLGTKTTPNPNTRALFKSVNTRTFSFSFKLIPLSQAESTEIRKIVKFFRTELYPEQILLGEEADKDGQVPLGYRFPNKIKIEMFYNENPNVATKILPCYLESMQTVYNATSMGMHEDGSFQEVDITLNFRESRTLSRDDVLNYGY